MNMLMKQQRQPRSIQSLVGASILLAVLLGGCEKQMQSAPVVRPVRSVVVQAHEIGDPIVVTGHLRARDEVNLAFRLNGKLIQRTLDVGDRVEAGQTVARLDAEVERNARNAAQADLVAAQAAVEQSEAFEKRLRDLLNESAVSRNDYELALRQLKTARAQAEAAQARLKSANEQLGFTELKSEVAGVVTEKGAEPGEVVQAGQTILTVARQGGRDAVFDMPAQTIREGLTLGHKIEVWLADNQEIKSDGMIREISPQADPITRNYQVKVELGDPPMEMLLGATVVGRLNLSSEALIQIPSSALTMIEEKPAVWVIDAARNRVRRREITIARHAPDSVIVAEGLRSGEQVVIAGVQELHEGQEVMLLGGLS